MSPAGNILALAGSPRAGGHTDQLLGALINPLAEAGRRVELIRLSDLSIAPCDHCGRCSATGVCAVEDDMRQIYRGLAAAEALVLSAPVYFLGVPAQAKAMIDRCQALWVGRHRLGRTDGSESRPAAFVSAAGHATPGVFDCSVRTVRAFLATTRFQLSTTVLAGGLDEEVGGSQLPLEEARRAGEALGRELAAANRR